jgi:CheY-like chemotaxis protein
MANILVLSGEEVILRALTRILVDARSDTVTTASSLIQVRAFAQQQVPDLIILEFTAQIDEYNLGIPVYQQIRGIEAFQEVPILFWMVPNPTYTYPTAQQLGVAGCVTMPSQPKELIEARDVILAGGTYYPRLK